MLTVAVPSAQVAESVGECPGATLVVWDPRDGEAPPELRDEIEVLCMPHGTGGRRVYERVAQLPKLAVIQLASAGYEHALPFIPPGVALANARGVHDTRTAEMALLLALASQRGLPQFLDAQRNSTWAPEFFPSVADQRVLVVGYGSIGAAIGARFRACEAHVEGVARTARFVPDAEAGSAHTAPDAGAGSGVDGHAGVVVHAVADLPSVLPHADIVVLVTPLDDSTRHLVDAEFLSHMHDGALLVNVGRGGVVDTDALLAELQAGRLRAALDVVDPEPLPQDHPLWSAPGCIVVPHIAGWAQLDDPRYVDLARRQIAARVAGEAPVNLVAGPGA